jgi:hypothetical protein
MSTHLHTEDYQCEKCNSTNSVREIVQDTKSYDNFYEMCFDCSHIRYLEEKTSFMSLEELNDVRKSFDLEEITQEQLEKNQTERDSYQFDQEIKDFLEISESEMN